MFQNSPIPIITSILLLTYIVDLLLINDASWGEGRQLTCSAYMASDWTILWVSWFWYIFIFFHCQCWINAYWEGGAILFSHSNYRVIFLYDLQMGKKADWLLKLAFWNAILCMKQWQAVVFPLSLTCLMYAGSLVFKSLLLVDSWKEHMHQGEGISLNCIKDILQNFLAGLSSTASNVLAWRNYVVVSLFIN